MISTNPFLPIILLRVTPSANRNTYSVATLIIHIPRVEALHASTLGYEVATPTEFPGVDRPHPSLPQGEGAAPQTSLNSAGMNSRPLGRAGEGPPVGLLLPLNHLLAIADIDAGRQRVPVLRHLDALQRVDALLAGGHVGVYGADAVGGGLYD